MNRVELGLKIAMILFVVISIVLGVTTWVFKKKSDEAAVELATAKTAASTADSKATKAQEDVEALKRLIGYTDEVSIITDKFSEEMKTIAPEAENPTYVSVVSSLQDKIHTLMKDIDQKSKSYTELSDKFAKREANTASIIAKAKEGEKKANNELKLLAAHYQKSLGEKDTRVTEAVKVAGADKVKSSALLKAAENREDEFQGLLDDQGKTIDSLRTKLIAYETPPADNPHGQITYVSPDGKSGSINLGNSSRVTRGLVFSVYEPTDMSEQGMKGQIEIIAPLNERESDVRITSRNSENPISMGDVIYSPGWSPGLQERYALAGKMDVNGKGLNDVELLRTLVTKSGAIVDSYQRPDGRQEGVVSHQTSCIILGTPPDEKSPQEFRITYTNMIGQANRYGVKTMQLNEFLRRVNYKPAVNRFDGNPRTSSRPAQTSPGRVSDLFTQEETGSAPRRPRKSGI